MLRECNVEHTLPWEIVRDKLQEQPEFIAITLESERQRMYKVNTLL